MTVQLNDLNDDIDLSSVPVGAVEISGRPGLYRNGVKRVVDTLLVLLTAPVTFPLVVLLALWVARDGHSPFYMGERVGRGGRVFRMVKLRTMVPNADRLLDAYLAANPEAKQEWHDTQKLKDDPRITPIGRFLRRSSLDELPQMWNVIVGDMALVGPRPMMPTQRVLYPGLAYYSLRPGLTGPWQVSDRNLCTFSKRAEFDRSYDAKVTMTEDFRLMFMTVLVVLRGTGY